MCNADRPSLLGRIAVQALILPLAGNALAATPSQAPLFLVEGVSPNLIVTLDDSGSMSEAYMPDGLTYYQIANRSNAYNPLYYNPALTYEAPWKVTFEGGRIVSQRFTTQFEKAYYDGFRTRDVNGTLDLRNYTGNGYANASIDYVNTTNSSNLYAHYYLFDPACPHAKNVASATASAVQNCAADWYYLDSTPNTCTKTCFSPHWVTSDSEKQNYANWFSFYRTRQLATRTAANLALYDLPDNIRVTWQGLTTCYSNDFNHSSSTCGKQTLAPFANQHKADFFTFTNNLPTSGGTPLGEAQNRVNKYLSSTSVTNPYARVPGDSRDVKTEYACRPTYHLLMTDGFGSGSGGKNADGTEATLPDGTGFKAPAPYKDEWQNTLADNIFLGWATDARTDLADKVPPRYREGNDYWNPKNDPATWQHVTTYTVGLGLGSTLKYLKWGGDTYSGSYAQLLDGTRSWPNPEGTTNLGGLSVTANEGKVAALWHGALNSRGEFFSADSTSELVSAFQTIVNSIATSQQAVAAAGASSTSLGTNTHLYRASYQPSDWSGDLVQYNLDSNGNALRNSELSFRNLLNRRSASSRKIYTNTRPEQASGHLQSFTWDNLSEAQQELLNRAPGASTDDDLGARRVAWLRGDRSDEGGKLRARNHLLGDIIYSSPVVVGPPAGVTFYMEKAAGASGYEAFKEAQAEREKRIYIGANDGMLHAFDEEGNEKWAFIPASIIDKLNYLSSDRYAARSEEENTNSLHRYFVDGTAVTQDVHFDGAWHTVLVMAPARGGRGLFALDITAPNSPELLWEHLDANQEGSGDIDLGYLLERPVIANLAGTAYVLTTTGYGTTGGSSLSIRLADGQITADRHDADNGDGELGGAVAWFLAANPGSLSHRYYSSLSGKLYRHSGNGSVSLLSTLAQARGQSMGTAAEVTGHPRGGQLVIAGTGKYFEASDKERSSTAQSLYGLWDQTEYLLGSEDAGEPTTLKSLGDLQQQTLTEETVEFSGAGGTTSSARVRQLSSNRVAWNNSGERGIGIRGWYLDLPVGEMILDQPFMLGDVLFATVSQPNEDPCSSGITYWLLAIDPKTGGALQYNVFDLTGDGSFSEKASGIQIDGPVTRIGDNLYTPSGAKIPLQLFDPTNRGRFNWRIMNFNLPTGYP